MSLAVVPVTVVLTAVLIASITDLRSFKINNLLTLPLIASGLLYHGFIGTTGDFIGSILGLLFGFGFLFVFYLMGGMGGGDVKLMAGLGAWLGMPLTVYVFVATAFSAGLFAIFLILANGRVRETVVKFQIIWHRWVAAGRHFASEDRVETALKLEDRRGRLVPFAAMMALGVFGALALAYLQSTVKP